MSKGNYEARKKAIMKIKDTIKRKKALDELNGVPVINVIKKIPQYVKYNCVRYARYKCPSLPYGLVSWLDKKKIINSHTPCVGNVCIIRTSLWWWHLAFVEKVENDQVYISESNWGRKEVTQRKGAPEDLNIEGYFNPKI